MSSTEKNKDFYIGYNEKAPKSYASFIKKAVVLALIFGVGLAFLLVKSQKGFSSGTFELGKQTELKGFVSLKPVPMLTLPDGSESTMLVSYGKFGAEKVLQKYFEEGFIDIIEATVSGTLIYNDGKSILELTDGEDAIIEQRPFKAFIQKMPKGEVQLIGEIIDPKCYFGVMKPGEGKIHKSCAIRCISGGIPPVLKVENQRGENQYFILRGQKGQQINDLVLEYIAEPVAVKGDLFQFNNWLVLNINENFGIKRVKE